MRILFIPWCGAKFTGDSNFLMFRRMARELGKLGCWSMIAVPEGMGKDLPREGRVEYVECLSTNDGFDFDLEEGALDYPRLVQEFSWKFSKRYVDFVVTSRRTACGVLSSVLGIRLILTDHFRKYMPTVFLDIFEERDMERLEQAQMLVNEGHVYSVFLTEWDRRERIKNTERRLGAAYAKRLEERSVVLNLGVNCGDVKEIREKSKKFEKFTVFFGGRLNITKSVDEILEVYDKLYALGKDWNIILTTAVGIGSRDFVDYFTRKNRRIEIYEGVSWKDYISLAARSHVFMSLSRGGEVLPVGFWEQLYAGCVGLFPKLLWANKQIPESYPYRYSTLNEAMALILEIERDYSKAQEALKPIWGIVERDFNYPDLVKRFLEHLKRWKNIEESYEVGEKCGELVRDIVEGRDFFSMKYVERELARKGEYFSNRTTVVGGRMIPSFYEIYRFLLTLGFEDTYNSSEPFLVRKGAKVPEWVEVEGGGKEGIGHFAAL